MIALNQKTSTKIHFPGAIICAIFILALMVILSYFAFFITTPQDALIYHNLKEATDPSKFDNYSNTYVAKQTRIGIQKDVLFTEGENRLQFRLKSSHSELVLDHHEDLNEVIENLHNVDCMMQEELYYVLPDGRETTKQVNSMLLIRNEDEKKLESWISIHTPKLKPMQIVRYIEAENASYYYQSDLFVAKQVKLSRYILPGHKLGGNLKGNTLIMKGTAKSVEFSFSGKEINFKATQLKASFYASGRLF